MNTGSKGSWFSCGLTFLGRCLTWAFLSKDMLTLQQDLGILSVSMVNRILGQRMTGLFVTLIFKSL
jgi:hypothetical protein